MKINDLEIIDLNEAFDSQEEENKSVKHKTKRKSIEIEDEEILDWKTELKSWIITLGITVIVTLVLKNYVIINANIPTGSMENTIMPGDHIVGYRLAYLLAEPERGDVIFFPYPDDESQKYVKRIVGLPGENIYIRDGEIYINDALIPLEEPYLKDEWVVGTGPFEFQVPEDSYLVLGDNRNNSQDARYWNYAYVSKEKIIGKAIFTYYPISRWGMVE